MKKEKKVWAITLIACWWLAPTQTTAQQDSLKSTTLSDVVITATKFPKNQVETGKVLTVIDETQLQRSAGKDLAQLLNEQAGLIVNGSNSNPAKDKSVYLRGAGSQYTVILIDGIPVNDPSGVGGAFDLRLLPIDQVERVEILKGSQSTLYGTDAIAGVINIITKKKGEKPLGGFGTLSYGSYNTFKRNIGVNGSTSSFDYNASYSHLTTDGISEAKDQSGNNNFDRDGMEQNSWQVSAGWRASEKFSIKPYFRYNEFSGKYDAGSFTDSKKNTYNTNLLNTGLSAQYALGKGALNLLYGYDKTDRAFDSDFGPFSFKGRFHHIEGFVNYDLHKNLQLLTGVNHQNIHMLDLTATEKNPTVTITSPYASLFLRDVNGLSLELGGRVNNHSRFGNTFTYSINPSYLIQNQIKLFFNASSGFKAPTLYQLFGQFGANNNLKPEVSQNLETGAQFFNRQKNFDMRVTAFQREIKDVIFYFSDPVTFQGTYINQDRQYDKGLETELTYAPISRLTLKAFYAFVDGEITQKTGSRDTVYNNLFRRPRNSFGFNAAYHITSDFFISANLKTFGQRSDLFFNLATFGTEKVSLDAYALLDVYMEHAVANGKLKLFIDAKNILNADYMEVYGYNTLRFNLMAGINARF
ncbi:MAG: TonB-dependent receptor [Cyclobacteriaceae bacterium]|nr:TonB-dependent receptor [Cyclobacteriaceae bacterium]